MRGYDPLRVMSWVFHGSNGSNKVRKMNKGWVSAWEMGDEGRSLGMARVGRGSGSPGVALYSFIAFVMPHQNVTRFHHLRLDSLAYALSFTPRPTDDDRLAVTKGGAPPRSVAGRSSRPLARPHSSSFLSFASFLV